MNVSILSIMASIGLLKPVASADTNTKSPSFMFLFMDKSCHYYIPMISWRHKGNSARRICKGTFHSPDKKSPVLALFVRYFLSFALDKYSVLRWQVFRKKEKNVVLWWVSVLSFCYRDLSAWWENRTDQLDMQYHFVIIGRLFLQLMFWYRFPFALSLYKCIFIDLLMKRNVRLFYDFIWEGRYTSILPSHII